MQAGRVFVFALLCAVFTAYAQETVTINIATMTAAHPQIGNAKRTTPLGLTVNNNEGPELKLQPGITYKFIAMQNCSFPLMISNSIDGGGDAGTSGVPVGTVGIALKSSTGGVISSYSAVCNRATIEIKPTLADVGKTLYYQCVAAPAMGWKISIVGTQVFNVAIKLMTAAHPQFPNPLRISTGYTINGKEGAVVQLSVGKTYRFKITSACSHPMYISQDQNGGGLDFSGNTILPGTHGITLLNAVGTQLPNNNNSYLQACENAILQWTPISSDIGKPFFYQCAYHIGMGWNVSIVSETFCEKYAKPAALGQGLFMDAVMTAIISNVVADPLLLPFFNAENAEFTSPKCCTTNFLNTTSEFLRLKKELSAFFGAFLGCTEDGFPQYTGPTDMKKLHALMPIATAEFNRFNSIVRSTILSLGVPATDYAPLGAFLESTKVDICNSGDCRTSFCDRYSDALKASIPTSEALVSFVVDKTIEAIVAASSPIKKYFDGTKPAGSVNFLDGANSAKLATLRAHLIQFFGLRGVLTCTDPAYPKYTGNADMKAVHSAMGITGGEFDFFNQALLGVLKAAGVTPVDLAAVLAVLETTRAAIVAQGVPPPPVGGIAATFTFTVAAKNASHANFNSGFPQGFYADKKVAVEFGKSYKFIYGGSCSHPLYLTTDAFGGGGAEITGGVDNSIDYTLVCGAVGAGGLTVSIDQNFCNQAAGNKVYYNCRIHSKMGAEITVTGCPTANTGTFCERYAKTLSLNHSALVTTVVDAVVVRLVNSTSPVLVYFNGSRPSGSVNFLTNTAALATLKRHLVEFFGQGPILGCSDSTIPPYSGKTDMMEVHKLMGISASEFDFFNQQILAVMDSVGVAKIDQAAVLSVLETTRSAIVGTFCARYSGALGLSNKDLVTTVVNGVVTKLVGPGSNLVQYFNGSRPAKSVNFLTNSVALASLKNHLVEFFGQMGVLSCNDGTIPAYSGIADMKQVHYPMGISASEFDEFNQAILSVMNTAGVSAADQMVVLSVLETTRGAIVATFCQRYAVALGVPQLGLLQTVVNLTVLKLVDPASQVKKYFDGTKPSGSTNFLTNGQAFSTLFDHLVQFFGQTGVLSCDDPNFPKYQGNSNMGAVHSQMGISNTEFDFFNQQLLGVMGAAGVTQPDRNAVLAVLETTRAGIVVAAPATTTGSNPPPSTTTGAPTGPTFCEKYALAKGLSQVDLVKFVVDKTVLKLIDPASPNKKYFDGTKPAKSTDFTAAENGSKLAALTNSLVAFFGQAGVLGCTDPLYPKYNGGTLAEVHKNMGISKAEFDKFNADLLSVMNEAGVSQADQTAVLGVLDSTNSAIVPAEMGGLQPWQIGVIAGVAAAVLIGVIVAVIFCRKGTGKPGEGRNYVAF